jgi:hypothetical protein
MAMLRLPAEHPGRAAWRHLARSPTTTKAEPANLFVNAQFLNPFASRAVLLARSIAQSLSGHQSRPHRDADGPVVPPARHRPGGIADEAAEIAYMPSGELPQTKSFATSPGSPRRGAGKISSSSPASPGTGHRQRKPASGVTPWRCLSARRPP